MNVDPNLKDGRSDASQNPVPKTRAATSRGPLVTAVVVIAVGIVLLLDQLGYMNVDFWPLVFVAAGLVLLLSADCWSRRAWGTVLILAGVVIGLNERGVTNIHFWQLWPLYIIVAGVGLLWNAVTGRKFPSSSSSSYGKAPSSPRFNSVYVFSGTDRKITAKDFEGGKISAIFGGFD